MPATTGIHHPLLQALLNLRWLSLFLIGPASGIALVGVIFGMPVGLLLLAVAMFAFTLSLFGLLVAGEYRRLKHNA